MNIVSKQYISNNKEKNSYTTIFKHYYDSSKKKVNKQGDIFALLTISAEKSVNVERISKFVWDSIVDGYLYSTSSTTNESLKESIKKGVDKVKELIKHDKELEQTGVDISFTIVLVKEEGTYVGVFGESDVCAFKKGSVVDVSKVLQEKKANTAGVALSKDDVLMVSTTGVLSKLSSNFSRLGSGREIREMLDDAGKNLKDTNALIYFSQQETQKKKPTVFRRESEQEKEKKAKEEKDPKETEKTTVEGALEEKTEEPTARVEKIKEPKKPEESKKAKESKVTSFLQKLALKEKLAKVKNFLSKISRRVSPFLKKVGAFLSEKWTGIKESIVKRVGRKKWFKKMASRWSEVRVKKRKKVGVQGMKIDNYKDRDLKSKRFKILGMAIVILILLVVGINFTIRMREAREISNLAQESFVQTDDLVDKVEENFVADRTSAETYLFQAERALGEVPDNLGEKDQERYEELKERILELGDALYKRVGVVEKDSRLTNYLDARLAFGEGSEVVDLTIYKDSRQNEFLVAADLGRKAIYRVSLYDKSVRALPDNSGLVSKPQFVYVGNDGVYVYDELEGVLKASFDEDGWFNAFTSLSGLGVSEVRSGDIATMTVWTPTDNVYFLSRDRSAFLRSTAAYADRYGLPYEYFSHELMEISTDMVADISIYIIVPEDPHILRFNYNYFEGRYVEAPLGVVGFDGDYGVLTKAFTGVDLNYPLYVFDSKGRRFLQLRKPIEAGPDIRHPNQVSLLNQYLYRGEKDSVWDDVRNFVVDFGEANMYILDGSVIWRMVL